MRSTSTIQRPGAPTTVLLSQRWRNSTRPTPTVTTGMHVCTVSGDLRGWWYARHDGLRPPIQCVRVLEQCAMGSVRLRREAEWQGVILL